MKCDLSTCLEPAVSVWYRSAADRLSMRGKSLVGVEAERNVCATHVPAWRVSVYVPIGTPRPLLVVPAVKVARKAPAVKHCQGCACGELLAVA